MTIYLYKKTHNKTGLQYLGKTTHQDPHKYRGSGVRWTNHIKKYGYDVTTEILKECSTNDEVKEWGLYYSNLWNVVNNKSWANLKEESGEGGAIIQDEAVVIEKLREVYGNRYDLSRVNYTGARHKITLVCDKHGPWSKMYEKVIGGVGCPKCNLENAPKHRDYNRLKTSEKFIEQAKIVHGEKYDYSLVSYINTDTKVKIICPEHGVFEQMPWGHLKYGCRDCGIISRRKKQ